MSRPIIAALSIALVLATAGGAEDMPPNAAEQPAATEIMRVVKSVLDPRRSGVRELTLSLSSSDGADRQWRARQAWKTSESGLNRFALVMKSPMEVRGSAMLVEERRQASNVQWVWLPAVGRVRKIVPIGRFEGLFGTDFTYSDLGFLSLHGRTFGDVERAQVGGVDAYVVQEKVDDEPWYYSRVETAVDRDKLWPIQRLFYDEAGDLWKRQVFERIEVIDGAPTLYAVRMENVPEGGSSSIVYEDVEYRDVPDVIFDPTKLPMLLEHPVWGSAQDTIEGGSEG